MSRILPGSCKMGGKKNLVPGRNKRKKGGKVRLHKSQGKGGGKKKGGGGNKNTRTSGKKRKKLQGVRKSNRF